MNESASFWRLVNMILCNESLTLNDSSMTHSVATRQWLTSRHSSPSVMSRQFLITRQWSFSVTSRQLVTTRQWFLLSRLVKLWRVVKWSFCNDSSTCDESWTRPTVTTRQWLTSRDKCVAFSTLVSNLQINDSMIYICEKQNKILKIYQTYTKCIWKIE